MTGSCRQDSTRLSGSARATGFRSEHINEIALLEPKAQDGPCVKPASALDLLLHSRKGPYQALMAREDIRIKRVPTALAYALASELEIVSNSTPSILPSRPTRTLPRWQVFDRKDRFGDLDPEFKDVVLRFNPAGGLKFLAEHALGFKPKFHFQRRRAVHILAALRVGLCAHSVGRFVAGEKLGSLGQEERQDQGRRGGRPRAGQHPRHGR